MRDPSALLLLIAILLGGLLSQPGYTQEWSSEPSVGELKAQLNSQASEIQDLRTRLEKQEAFFEATEADPTCSSALTTRLPVVVESTSEPTCESGIEAPKPRLLKFYSEYDEGFVTVRPVEPTKHPFELKLNGWIQFRHHAFCRDVETWTDNAGVTRPVQNRNAFDIERARLVFSGFVHDPRLSYFLQLDGDTDGGHVVDFFDYWWAWEFSDRFQVQLGKRKVPASRQWLLGARNTRLIDRPMANDFFRPDRTVGLFGVGKLGETGHYEIMVGNGYGTADLPNSLTDSRFTYAATNYFDPWGPFGGPLVDFESTPEPLLRIGHSFVYSPQESDANRLPRLEADFVRLTDGTRLTQVGALSPGVIVTDFDVYLYCLDAAMKYRGWSINSEVFLRWIEQIRGTGEPPVGDLFQRGFYVEGGHFLIPKSLDVNVRYSQVSGLFGNGSEYAVGMNWYPFRLPAMKVSFDVTLLDGSPLQNSGSDILVGDDGVLFRTQFQADF